LHLEPPNTAAVPQARAAQPQALASSAPTRMAVRRPSLEYLEGPQIEKTFVFHRRYFHKLYTERLRARPGLAGSMRVNFTINADGTTRDATMVASDLRDPVLEQAVLRQIGEMMFPAAKLATPVEDYPIAFQPPSQPRKK
jgi:outer membrane biosynthesis protein TonB